MAGFQVITEVGYSGNPASERQEVGWGGQAIVGPVNPDYNSHLTVR